MEQSKHSTRIIQKSIIIVIVIIIFTYCIYNERFK
jgi:hypothetical protein